MATPKLMKPVVTLKKAGSQDVKVAWKKVTGADGYQIYRSTSINGQFKLVKTIKKGDTLSWKDTSTVKGKKYCYKVRAYDVKKDKTKKYSAYSTIKTIKR
jgi:fibronectin type 3 domain-containing protein